MKYNLCLIILLCSISCYGQEEKLQTKENEDNKENKQFEKRNTFQGNNGYRESDDYQKYENYDEEYIGNPDLDAKIERPCRVYDLNCIRRFFADHSKCKIRRGPLPRNLFISQESLYFARVNVTATLNNVNIGGFRNSRIEEFYINRRTNKVVFSINIRGLSTNIPSAYFRFYRNGREPIVIVTEAGAFYTSLTFTAVIPNIDNLQLDKAEITNYADAVPFFFLGPELLNNTDPAVAQSLVEFMADAATDTQELMLTESQFYPVAYIQYNICDFGLKTLPVDSPLFFQL